MAVITNNIKSEGNYEIAVARLEVLTKALPGKIKANELKILTLAIVDYLKIPGRRVLAQESATPKER